ncbi:MAG: hypothetical protein J3R72DRAFT_449276 [Linnemannia gamsii]|nr:MAG: hypothetical protein J3R72DRAFT_449276 [Linnemannia gamsii]
MTMAMVIDGLGLLCVMLHILNFLSLSFFSHSSFTFTPFQYVLLWGIFCTIFLSVSSSFWLFCDYFQLFFLYSHRH